MSELCLSGYNIILHLILFYSFVYSLVHPLSPRGKLVHGGREGLTATNRLIHQAIKYKPFCVLRDKLYRVALTEKHLQQLQQTALHYPEFCKWISPEELKEITGTSSLGGVQLTNGCKVLHVPSYLEGLWMACMERSNHTARWSVEPCVDEPEFDWRQRLQEFDTVVLAAGAGLFQTPMLNQNDFPVDLIRGQSIEMVAPANYCVDEALLCGKYISPLPERNLLLIGATHEYTPEPLSEHDVVKDLKERCYKLAPNLWDYGTVKNITVGFRVQSRRGAFGRVPIVGRLDFEGKDAWIFTGLSSRGLLYHGLYGDILTNAMLGKRNETLWNEYNLDWWRQTGK
jgi:glycine/D-amino acid oxidase-like deaminating enzyme